MNMNDLDCKPIEKNRIIESILDDINRNINKIIKRKRIYTGSTSFFNENKFDEVMNSKQLFVRKVNTEKSSKLIDKIDSVI